MKEFLIIFIVVFFCNICRSQKKDLSSLGPEPITNLDIFRVAEEQIYNYDKLITGQNPNFVHKFLTKGPEIFLEVIEVDWGPNLFKDSMDYYNNISFYDSIKALNKITYMKIFECDTCAVGKADQAYKIIITTWHVDDNYTFGSSYFSIEGVISLLGKCYVWSDGDWKLHSGNCY